MPYFRIIIHLRDKSTRTGIRHFHFEDQKTIRLIIKEKTEDVTGPDSVEDIDLIELDVFSAEVVQYILSNKQMVKRPRPFKPTWKHGDKNKP